MTPDRSAVGSLLTVARVAILLLVAGLPLPAAAQSVATWESAIAGLGTPDVSGRTVRQFARISVGGAQLRIRISNETGTKPLAVADAHVALPDSAPGSVQPATDHVVTFNGGATIVVAPGAGVISDPVDMRVPPLTRLAVSAFFRSASPVQVGHLVADETNYVAMGDHAAEAAMAGATPTGFGFYLAGLSAVVGDQPGGAVACLGDSLTDGLYSTSGAERRYPDQLAGRLLAATGGRVGAIDAGLSGNSVLGGDPLGIQGAGALARLSRDVLARPGVHWMILWEGINDILSAPDGVDVAAELAVAYGQIVAQAHEAGVKVFGATLTPFLGSGRAFYSAAREADRQRVNSWIRSAGAFDAVFDFDAVVRDPADPRRILPAYDGGDHLHLDDAGYAAVAASIPLEAILRGR